MGDDNELFVLDDHFQLLSKLTHITVITGIETNHCNTECISLLDPVYNEGGVLIDPVGKSVVALWMAVCGRDSKRNNEWEWTGLNFNFYISSILESLRQRRDS